MLIFAANKVIFGGARAVWLMHHKTGEVDKILEFTDLLSEAEERARNLEKENGKLKKSIEHIKTENTKERRVKEERRIVTNTAWSM